MIKVNMTVHTYVCTIHTYIYLYRSTHLAAHELNSKRERERKTQRVSVVGISFGFRCFEDDTRTMNLIMIKRKKKIQFYSQQSTQIKMGECIGVCMCLCMCRVVCVGTLA